MKNKCVVIQKNISDCGACSILSILKYYNGFVPLTKILDDTLTDKSGTNAYEIMRTLGMYGFTSYGLKINLNSLNKNILPVIAHTNKCGYEHFVVIYDEDEKNVLVMDPEVGKKIYTREDFEKIFQNVVITAIPNGKIVKMKKSGALKNLYKQYLKKYFSRIFIIFLFSILLLFTSIVPSFYIKFTTEKNLIYAFIIFFIILLFKGLLVFYESKIQGKLSIVLNQSVNEFILKHIFGLKVKYIKNRRIGEIIEKVQDLFFVNEFFMQVLVMCFLDVLLLLIGLLISFIISHELALIFVISAIFSLFSTCIRANKMYKNSRTTLREQSLYSGNLTEYMGALESIKHLSKEDYFLNKLFDSFDKSMSASFKNEMFSLRHENLKNIIQDTAILGINMYGLNLCFLGSLSLVDLVTLNSIILMLNTSFNNIMHLVPKFIHTKAIFSQLSEFLDIEKENNSNNKMSSFNGIIVDNLSYTYDYYHYVIKNLSLNIPLGTKLLIRGISGSGKSTFVKCLSGELDNYEGSIKIGDYELRDIAPSSLRESIMYIGQNEVLFTDSIKENITLGTYDENYLQYVMKLCNIGEIVSNRNSRENTIILDGASNISGGEKARIILARVLFKKPKVLIIDETLSSLNSDMEDEILDNLFSIKNLTLIYITHRNKEEKFKNILSFRKEGIYEIKR